MFTGIIQEVGIVKKISRSSALYTIGIQSDTVSGDANISDSIAVNGVCLTVVKKESRILSFQAIPSTVLATNLKSLLAGDRVNLESALRVGDKLGGHFVLGHVDVASRLRHCVKQGDSWQLEIELPSGFRKYVVANGSVALEGASLTIKKVLPRSFIVGIIPFTYEQTNLKYKKIGTLLNVEFDYLLKKSS